MPEIHFTGLAARKSRNEISNVLFFFQQHLGSAFMSDHLNHNVKLR